jgi:hypothetical protein
MWCVVDKTNVKGDMNDNDSCLMTLLANKTRLLVTHNLNVLPRGIISSSPRPRTVPPLQSGLIFTYGNGWCP